MIDAITILLFLIMPIEITATNNADMDSIREQMIQLEIDSREWRQEMTYGGGL